MNPTPVSSALSNDVLFALSESSQACVERLCKYETESVELPNQQAPVLAAVLIVLYERPASTGAGRGSGGLRVLLTTRSKELRSHPGQTALPGGKVDKTDNGLVETAFREANEEVGFPLCSPHVRTLCMLEPFVSPNRMLVTPVIAFLDDVSVLQELRAAPGEVARIFDHPLEALLDPELLRDSEEKLVPLESEDWPYETELHSFSDVSWLGTMYRMHRFRSTASPVKGLTADILLATAEIAYGREPMFQRWAPGQWKTFVETQKAVEAVTTPGPLLPVGQPKPPHRQVMPSTTVRA